MPYRIDFRAKNGMNKNVPFEKGRLEYDDHSWDEVVEDVEWLTRFSPEFEFQIVSVEGTKRNDLFGTLLNTRLS